MKKSLRNALVGSLMAVTTIVPAFADTTNLKYEANVQSVLSISIEAPDGTVMARDGETAVLNFGNVDAFGLNIDPIIDSVRLVKDKDLYDVGKINNNDSALYTIGSNISQPTVNLRSRIQGGGTGKIEHTFQSKMDGMEIVFASSNTPWLSAQNLSELDPDSKMRYFGAGANPMTIAGPDGVYKEKGVSDNELVGFDIALNVKPSATTGAKEATSTFRLLPL